MTIPFVVSIVLNTNHRDDTLECLNSLEKNTYENHRILLLDNSSTDGTVEAVRAAYPSVQIIELKENHGYAGNNNVGIEEAVKLRADWVFVLNEDTILSQDCIASLISEGEKDPKIGIVGPLVYHYNEPGVIQTAGGKMNQYFQGWHLGQDEKDCGQYQHPMAVDWISGCGILVRCGVINQVGAIDARVPDRCLLPAAPVRSLIQRRPVPGGHECIHRLDSERPRPKTGQRRVGYPG